MMHSFAFGPDRPQSPAEQWRIAVQNAPVVLERLPLELALSYPVPGNREVAFFHYRWNRADQSVTFATRITAALPSLAITTFQIAESDHLFPGLPGKVYAEPKSYNREMVEAFYEASSILEGRFPNRPAGSLGTQWLEALEIIVPVVLFPYYEALNPAFFAWCRGGMKSA